MATHSRWVLASRPSGMPEEANFRLEQGPVPEAKQGELLAEILYLTVDPYMRGRIKNAASYAKPVEIGELMQGGGVGRVIASNNPKFAPGDIVEGMTGWQSHVATDGKGYRKVDPSLAPVSTALGILGMPGLTAYFGLLDVGQPKAGETVLVSGAAGAVGSLVGQIGKITGCRVVGIAGADDKCRWLTEELGFDAAFNYKTVADYRAKLRELCPNGIDVYFDNVGGTITDAAIAEMNQFGRISICGQISGYNADKPETGPRLLFHFVVRRLRAQGFLVFDFFDRYPEGLRQMAAWLSEGKLKYREQFDYGIERVPAAFIAMLEGQNTGKMLVKVAD
ncbi:MAG: NADP-dependent oxidoreductase [Bryobacterales bacterium]|nr:NADP-dependent oxidoreductase [Bryobacterales bacterium]